jgi:hypothetical protein
MEFIEYGDQDAYVCECKECEPEVTRTQWMTLVGPAGPYRVRLRYGVEEAAR